MIGRHAFTASRWIRLAAVVTVALGLLFPVVAGPRAVAAEIRGASATPRSGGRWEPPVPITEATLVRRFVLPPGPYAAGHRGVDVAAPAAAAVRAAGDGVVAFAGLVAGRPVVVVDHPNALRTTYEPVAPVVRVGDEVSTGAVLGRLVALGTHCPPRACLHWGLRRGDAYLDPLALLGSGPARLLPLGPTGARPPRAARKEGGQGERRDAPGRPERSSAEAREPRSAPTTPAANEGGELNSPGRLAVGVVALSGTAAGLLLAFRLRR